LFVESLRALDMLDAESQEALGDALKVVLLTCR
jgi:hypothetical protein